MRSPRSRHGGVSPRHDGVGVAPL